jgi:Domain of unknown function (DUF4360)
MVLTKYIPCRMNQPWGSGGVDKTQIYEIPPGKASDYQVETDLLSTAFTPCNTMNVPMSVNTRIRLFGEVEKFNTLTVDSLSQKVKTILNLKWKSCDNP